MVQLTEPHDAHDYSFQRIDASKELMLISTGHYKNRAADGTRKAMHAVDAELADKLDYLNNLTANTMISIFESGLTFRPAGGCTRRGEDRTFPSARSRPALPGRDAARGAEPCAHSYLPGATRAETQRPISRRDIVRPDQDTRARKSLVR